MRHSHSHIHAHTHAHTHTHTHTTHTHTHTHTRANTHQQTQAHTRTHTRARDMPTRTHACTHTHTHTHTQQQHTHTHIMMEGRGSSTTTQRQSLTHTNPPSSISLVISPWISPWRRGHHRSRPLHRGPMGNIRSRPCRVPTRGCATLAHNHPLRLPWLLVPCCSTHCPIVLFAMSWYFWVVRAKSLPSLTGCRSLYSIRTTLGLGI